jgi:hypothetical protein
MDSTLPWAALLGLGAIHGLNPAMGWLFAVSLALQEGSGRAVWRSMGPLAAGHAGAIAAALVAATLLGVVVPLSTVKWIAGAALIGTGIVRLRRHSHPRWGGMQVGPGDLAIWSFLTASAHGAGLMALPFALEMRGASSAGHVHGAAQPGSRAPELEGIVPGLDLVGLLATVVHTAGYLAIAGVLALVVYHWLGLRLLRRAWLNIDLVWGVALVLTGVVTVTH